MSGARALFAGPGALRALVDGRGGVVEVVLRAGAYVRLGSDWLLLAEPDAPFGPLSVAVHGLGRLSPRPGAHTRVSRGRLVLGDDAVSLARVRERRPVVTPSVARGEASAVAAACAVALAELPGPPSFLLDGIAELAAARPNRALRSLAGLGPGLTPAGDDVLAGYAGARVAVGAPVALSVLAAQRSSALGLAYLRCAERGELPDAGARLLAAIAVRSVAAVWAALPPLREWGTSSGAALAWGITAAFAHSIERSW